MEKMWGRLWYGVIGLMCYLQVVHIPFQPGQDLRLFLRMET